LCHHRQVAFSASRNSLFVRDYAGERRRELDTAGRLADSEALALLSWNSVRIGATTL
jgi:hypothetical protein